MRAIGLVLCLAFVGCSTTGDGTDEHWYFSSHEHNPDWGYTGATGPEHWGDLSPNYAAAKNGRQQSPIDISSSAAGSENPSPTTHHASGVVDGLSPRDNASARMGVATAVMAAASIITRVATARFAVRVGIGFLFRLR